MITLTTPDASRIEVERAPDPQKFVLEVTPRAQSALALGTPDDGKVVNILRDVHEDGSAGHAFELAADVFVWHRAQPCRAASVRPVAGCPKRPKYLGENIPDRDQIRGTAPNSPGTPRSRVVMLKVRHADKDYGFIEPDDRAKSGGSAFLHVSRLERSDTTLSKSVFSYST